MTGLHRATMKYQIPETKIPAWTMNLIALGVISMESAIRARLVPAQAK